jgi:phage protein D
MAVKESPFDPVFTTRDGKTETFYVPAFRVETGPNRGALSPIFDVQSVTVKEATNQLGSFEVLMSASDWAPTEPRYPVMPGDFARIWLGYQGPMGLFVMLTGQVNSVSLSLGAASRTLQVRGVSGLDRLREAPTSKNWRSGRHKEPPIKYSDAVKQIAARYDGLIPIVPSGVKATEPEAQRLNQANESDMAFLVRLAQRRGYVVCFREFGAPPPAGQPGPRYSAQDPKRFIYFGPSNLLQQPERGQMGERPKPLELMWGLSLLDFKPTFTVSSSQFEKVTASFWNRQKKKKEGPIVYTLDDLWTDEHGLNQDLDPFIARDAMGSSEVPEVPLDSLAEARDLARATLRENFLGMVTADGTTVGQPELRSGSRVRVSGIGLLDGSWFLTSVTHTLDDNGYLTKFSARREQVEGA